MTTIKDGLTADTARVNSSNQLVTRAITASDFEHASELGLGFVWASTYSATGGEEVISIKNDNVSKRLHIGLIYVSSAVDCIFTVLEVTSGTPAGTPVVGSNLAFDSGVPAEATAFGNASVTGSVDGDTVGVIQVLAKTQGDRNFQGAVILAKDDVIAVRASASGVAYVEIYGHYEDV